MSDQLKIALTAVVFCAVFSARIMADADQWYIGGSIGKAWPAGLDDLTATDLAQAIEVTGIPPEFTPSIVSTSSSSTSFDDFEEIEWKLYAGYQFNDYLGLEALYAQLGSFEREARLSGAVGLFAPAFLKEETEAEGYGVSLVGTYPLTSRFSVFAKAGVFSWEADTSGSLGVQTGTICAVIICGPVASEKSYSIDDSGADPMYGLGVVSSWGSWALRFEWERFTGLSHGFDSESDMDFLTLGFQYQFGVDG